MFTWISITSKDIQLLLMRSNGILQSIMLGLLLIFLLSLSQKVGEVVSAQSAAVLFTIASVFCVILITNALFTIEQQEGIRINLLLSNISLSSFAFGKWLALFILLLITQIILLPATLILLNQTIYNVSLLIVGIVLLNTGVTSIGVLLGVITQQSSAKDSMLTVLLFPLLLPLLLATIRIIEYAYSTHAPPITSWLMVACSFVLLFFTALLILFPLLFTNT